MLAPTLIVLAQIMLKLLRSKRVTLLGVSRFYRVSLKLKRGNGNLQVCEAGLVFSANTTVTRQCRNFISATFVLTLLVVHREEVVAECEDR